MVVDFRVEQEDSVYPMVPAGADLNDMIRRDKKEPIAAASALPAAHNPIFETGEDQ